MQTIAHGAEAIITKKANTIIKQRTKKTYRHPEIDQNLRKTRLRQEARILERLQNINFPSPRIINVNENKATLEMDFIDGKLVKEVFNKHYKILSKEIGKKIAILHQQNIIHGDLTTSNMIINNEIFFIDFGLSFLSKRVEDRAVDLHLLDRALESKHYRVYPECIQLAIQAYKKHYPEAKAVLERLDQVNKRGRYKGKH
jgi:Kae1-associated kinase Bud32